MAGRRPAGGWPGESSISYGLGAPSGGNPNRQGLSYYLQGTTRVPDLYVHYPTPDSEYNRESRWSNFDTGRPGLVCGLCYATFVDQHGFYTHLWDSHEIPGYEVGPGHFA